MLCLSLTPLTPSTDVNAPGLICSLTQQQPPFFLGPFDGNTCPHVCGLSVWFPLFQKEASPPQSPSPGPSHVPPSLCSGVKQPSSSFLVFLHTATDLLVATVCVTQLCYLNAAFQPYFFHIENSCKNANL